MAGPITIRCLHQFFLQVFLISGAFGLFTQSQIPLLIMRVENFYNSANWVEARKLRNHLIWLLGSKFTAPDQFMVDELQVMSRLHMRGVDQDEESCRAHHLIRALYSNRLAINAANAIWPTNYERKAGDRYLEQFAQFVDGDSSEALEKQGIVKLYEADWLPLFDRNADVNDIYTESRKLLEQAGISRAVVDELMSQPLLQPKMGYYANAEQIVRARSSRAGTGDGMSGAVSITSVKLCPFSDMIPPPIREIGVDMEQ